MLDMPAEPGACTRARYLTPVNSFREKLPPVPAHVFAEEFRRAADPAAATGMIDCDIAERLASPVPATTPLLLARYIRIRAGERLAHAPVATQAVHYVIAGSGRSRSRAETIEWRDGDVFCFAGGAEIMHEAGGADALLWTVTNEPELAFHRVAPSEPAALPAVHYPAGEIRRHLDAVLAQPDKEDASGRVVVFATPGYEKMLSLGPTLTLALNSMKPGQAQRAHRHNSVAVTLPIAAEGSWSSIDGGRVDWQRHATMITPPGAAHSHHNDGPEPALFLIVQDGGLYYHCRTIGFAFA